MELDKRPTNPIFWIFFILVEVSWGTFAYYYYQSQAVGSAKSGLGDVWLSLRYESYSFNAFLLVLGLFSIYFLVGILIKSVTKTFVYSAVLLAITFILTLLLFFIPVNYNY